MTLFLPATTSICVTGLVVVPTYLHWSAFGKVVILLLIQLGGLGIISFTTGIMMVIGRRITLHDRILLEDALNLNTLSGLVAFLRKIFCGTFIIEGIGALGYTFLFIPKYGLLRGIWYSIFHSVSAFCNAGIDLLGNNSLSNYLTNTWMNVVTMFLIISGGIGFIVWWDLLDAFKNLMKKEKTFSFIVKKLRVHTKLVLITTFILLFGGMLLILLFEYDNTATIGNLDFYHKILASLFQSVTTRTAGFLTISAKQSASSYCFDLYVFDVYRRFINRYSRRNQNNNFRSFGLKYHNDRKRTESCYRLSQNNST